MTMVPAVAGCSGAAGGSANCPGCGLTTVAVTYTGTFVQGVHGAPVTFTASGQTATVQFTATQGGNVQPAAAVSGSFSPPCSAASVQSGPAAGQLTVTSTGSGNCTLVASSTFGTVSVGVAVP